MINNFFFDRDGVINLDTKYPYHKSEIKFINDTIKFLEYLTRRKKKIFIITNQSGISRGYYKIEDFLSLNTFFENYFKKNQIKISKTYFCPHLPNKNCKCRKPNNGLLLKAINEFKLNPKSSIMIGDKLSDVLAGINSGFKRNFLVSNKKIKDLKDPRVFQIKNVLEIKKFL